MSEPKDWTLLAKYLSNECSENEKNEVDKWIAIDDENKKLVNLMKKTWNADEKTPVKSDVKKIWSELSEKIEIADQNNAVKYTTEDASAKRNFNKNNKFSMFKFPVLRYAAIIIVLISFAFFFTNRPGWQKEMDLITVSVNKGDMQTIKLSDGTIVKLDAGSSLSYPEKFNDTKREVIMNGEGFFEVVSDKEKPFIIKANHSIIKVLGTKFNVRSWQRDKKVTVAVTEGKVSLQPENNNINSVIITKGKLSVLAESGVPTIPQKSDVIRNLGWMNKEMFFEDAPLNEILFQLERWYNVKFELSNRSILSERFDLNITNQPLDEILDLISVLTNSKFEQSGKTFYLKEN